MAAPKTALRRPGWWPAALLVAFFAGVFAAVAPGYIQRYHIAMKAAGGIYVCFLLMVILVLTPSVPVLRKWRPKPLLLPLIWCSPYLAYAAGTGDFRSMALAKLLAVALPLVVIYGFVPVHDLDGFAWQDLLLAVWLIAALMSGQLRHIWTVPANLDFMVRLFLIAVSAWTWVFIRRVPELGYEFAFSLKTLPTAALNFGLFALIAIPAGLALHFIEWHPQWRGVWQFCFDYLGIFLFIALLEELFFRGFLQTLISKSIGSARNGQIMIACLFGLFHVLHAPFPNWRYVVLAAVAGWFYGSAFVKGGNLMAPAITHAMVDTLWRTLFSKS